MIINKKIGLNKKKSFEVCVVYVNREKENEEYDGH